MLNHLGALENALVRLCVTPGLACYGECRNNTGKQNVETGNVVPQPSVEGWDLAMEFPDFPALGS